MQSQPHSPSRAGMLNKIKKKLTKGRRYEISTLNEDSDTESGVRLQNSKFEVLDSSQRDKSPAQSTAAADSPKRPNLVEKDTNKVNTYTKDPTKEHKVTSPLKGRKPVAKANGPILYINNTYDLPPFIPSSKGSIGANISLALKNSDNANTEINEENKENTKTQKGHCKSPYRNKRERGSNSRSNSRNRSENGVVSRSNSNSKSESLVRRSKSSPKPGGNTSTWKEVESKTEALKNASAVIANSKDSEDSDDYYITCELPGPNSVIAKLSDGSEASKPTQANTSTCKFKDKNIADKSLVLPKPERIGRPGQEGNEWARKGDAESCYVKERDKFSGSACHGTPAPGPTRQDTPPSPPGSTDGVTKSKVSDNARSSKVGKKNSINHAPQNLHTSEIKGSNVNSICPEGINSKVTYSEGKNPAANIQHSGLKSTGNQGPAAGLQRSNPSLNVSVRCKASDASVKNDPNCIVIENKDTAELNSKTAADLESKQQTFSLLNQGESKLSRGKPQVPEATIDVPANLGTQVFQSLAQGVQNTNESTNTADIDKCVDVRQKNKTAGERVVSKNENKLDKQSVERGAKSHPDVKLAARYKTESDTNGISAEMDENYRRDKGVGYSSLADVQKYFSSNRNETAGTSSPKETLRCRENAKNSLGYDIVSNSNVSDKNGNLNTVCTTKSVIKCDVNIHGGHVGTVNRPRVSGVNPVRCDVTKPKNNEVKSDRQNVVKPSEGYTTLDDFLGSSQPANMPKEQSNIAKIIFESKGARPKQRSVPFNRNDNRSSPASSPKISRSSNIAHLDVNLNLQYQREVSHESGYETSGSGIRSHSSSSNEFFQHDLSNYSLLSECTDEDRSGKNAPSLHENQTQHGAVYRKTVERTSPVQNARISAMYALVPRGGPRQSENDDVTCITSPESATQETLKDASSDDSDDSGNDVNYDPDDDPDDEINDYLPPIPTRNYDSEETPGEDLKLSEQNRNSTASSEDSDVLDGRHIDQIVAEFKAKNSKGFKNEQASNEMLEIQEQTIDFDKKITEISKEIDIAKSNETETKKEKISPSKLQEVKKLLYSPLHKARSGALKSRKSETEKDKSKRSSTSLHNKILSKESLGSCKSVSDKAGDSRQDISPVAASTTKGSNESTPKVVKRNQNSPEKSISCTDSVSDVYNHGSFSSDSTASLDQQFWASFEEPVHMSWEEVVSQANELGIPLSTVRNSRTSGSSVSSGESVPSPSQRHAPQTLPYPKHGSDKLKRFGTLKDKFASLFNRKSANIDRSVSAIQNRVLPLPPNRRGNQDGTRHQGNDDVDGGSSPIKRHRQQAKGVCQIHGPSQSSPRHHHSNHSMQSYCNECSPSKCSRMTQSYHQGSQCSCACSQSSMSDSCHSNVSWHGSYGPGSRGASKCRCCHRVSDSAIHENRRSDCRTLDRRGPLYPKAFPVHDSSPGSHQYCCHGSGAGHVTTERRTRSESHDQRRDRSHSRDIATRSRSPHLSSPLYPKTQCHGQCCYHGDDSPRQTRSSSSSGIVQRCPPSPAPSSGTSIMSAPSAFSIPLSRDHSPAPHRECCLHGSQANADFIGSLSKLKDVGWYWGPLSWDEAESKLLTKPDGSFIVRDSSDDRYILSLSFRSQGATHHTRIEHYKGMFSFYSQPKSHGAATIIEFIEKAMEHSRSGKFLYFLRPRAPGLPPAPVQLLYPISRFRTMQTLQHCCRFEILKHVRRDHICELPVPQKVKDYLEESQYYIESLGDDAR